MQISDRVIQITDDQIQWDFDGNPKAILKTANSQWVSYVTVDPFPCYSHDIELVRRCAEEAEERFRIGFKTFWFTLPMEASGRTNGAATDNTIKYKGDEKSWDGVIYLSGKRIPLHPGMTRYLCFHEYGHIVDNWICYKRKLEHSGFDNEYAQMRGIENFKGYGGRRWHKNVGEVIANDFRIAVCGIEPEFWPHPGIEHPNNVPAVHDWWYKAMIEHSV
jgi:hypothetical protein